jgi:hypothetical protein
VDLSPWAWAGIGLGAAACLLFCLLCLCLGLRRRRDETGDDASLGAGDPPGKALVVRREERLAGDSPNTLATASNDVVSIATERRRHGHGPALLPDAVDGEDRLATRDGTGGAVTDPRAIEEGVAVRGSEAGQCDVD